jgi:hypothetical protein
MRLLLLRRRALLALGFLVPIGVLLGGALRVVDDEDALYRDIRLVYVENPSADELAAADRLPSIVVTPADQRR